MTLCGVEHLEGSPFEFKPPFVGLAVDAGNDVFESNQLTLGGENGLPGYPADYQSGDRRVVFNLEQRYYTDWYPFRLARVGGAIFADVGRAWGPNPLGADHRDWLVDVGFGLRFALTRVGSGKVVHLDIAFPLNGDDSIDSVQFVIESKKSF